MDPNKSTSLFQNDSAEFVSGDSRVEISKGLEWKIPVGIVLSIISLWTSVGNAFVIYAIRKTRRLRTVNNYFILSLSVADFGVGSFVVPVSGILILADNRWILPQFVCQLWLSADYVMSTASILNLTVLSVDRYLSIRSPLAYLKERTKRRAYIIITCVWILSSIWIIPIYGYRAVAGGHSLDIYEGECQTEFNLDLKFKFVSGLFNFWLPLSIIIFTYIRIFGHIRKNSRMQIGQKTTLGALVKQTALVPGALGNNLKNVGPKENVEDKKHGVNNKGESAKVAGESVKVIGCSTSAETPAKNRYTKRCSTASNMTSDKGGSLRSYRGGGGVASHRPSNVSVISEAKSKSVRSTSASMLLQEAKSKFIISHSSEIKAAKQLGILASCFIVCWLPYFILFQVVAACSDCVSQQLITITIWLGYLNSSVNPLIYPLCNRHFKDAFKLILCGKKYGPNARYLNQKFGTAQQRTPVHLRGVAAGGAPVNRPPCLERQKTAAV